MTVLSNISSVSYATNGVTNGPFTIPFYFLVATDLVVQKTIAAITSTLVLNADYTVLGSGDPNGGSISTLSPIATGTVTIYRDPSMIQDASYQDHGRFPAKSHETALDRGTMIDQRLSQRMDDLYNAIAAFSNTTAITKAALLLAISGNLTNGIFGLDRWIPESPENSYRWAFDHARDASSLSPALLAYMQASTGDNPPGLGLTLSAAQAKLAQLLAIALTQPQ